MIVCTITTISVEWTLVQVYTSPAPLDSSILGNIEMSRSCVIVYTADCPTIPTHYC